MHARASLRTSFRGAYLNAGIWGLGSGLASLTLVLYFARELRASATAIAWLIAAPSLAGMLRLLTAWMLERIGSRRRFCVAMFLASSVPLAALPILARPGALPNRQWSIVALGAAWATYQVLEYIGVVALWAWYGDLAPGRIRGRFIGRREAWMTGGIVAGSLCAAAVTWAWQRQTVDQPELMWRSYAACASFGAALLALAAMPLVHIRDVPVRRASPEAAAPRLRELVAPLVDPDFRRLLIFGLWFSVLNGLVQSPRQIYMASVLRIELAEKRLLDGMSRAAQAALMPGLGILADRRGNVRLLAASWLIVAVAPVFFVLATPTAKWWVAGAYLCWIAYAGMNITLPNLMLGLSPAAGRAHYAAAWFAWTQLAYSASVLAGGVLLDWLASHFTTIQVRGWEIDHYRLLFIASGIAMAAGTAMALRIRERRRLADASRES